MTRSSNTKYTSRKARKRSKQRVRQEIASKQRVQQEIQDILKNNDFFKKCYYKLELIDGNFADLKGEIFGAEGTPYETGRFLLSITIPIDYPFKPPAVKFLIRIWHPYISPVTGYICLDILQNNWTATLNIRAVIISLQDLLSRPVPEDPLHFAAGSQYERNKEMFDKTAQYWTRVYLRMVKFQMMNLRERKLILLVMVLILIK